MTDRRSLLDFYQPDDTAPLTPTKVGPKVERPSWSSLYDAQKTLAQADLPRADQEQTYEAWRPWVDALNQGRSWTRRYHNPAAGGANPDLYIFDEAGVPQIDSPGRADGEARLFAAIDARRGEPQFKDFPKTLEAFHDAVVARAKQSVGAAREVTGRSGGVANFVTGLAAGGLTSFRDEYNIMSMPLGGVGRTAAMRIATAALGNMAVEAVEQPFVAQQRKRLGEDLTAGEAATNIAAAGVFGGGLQGAGEIGAKVIRSQAAGNAYRAGRDMATRMRDRIGWDRMTPGERSAVIRLERDADTADVSPFTGGAGTEAHMARMNHEVAKLDAGVVAPPAPAPPRFDYQRYANKIGMAESGGKYAAQAKTSSAYGLYQITRGTWLRYAKQVPALKDMPEATAWDRRTNPAAQEAIFTALTRDNRSALARAGVPESDGNLYLMHFAGSGAGTKILKAAPGESIERLLSAKAVEANPFLKGKTAEDVIAWAHGKMGDKVPDGPVLSREGFEPDDAGDVEWRAAQAEVDAAERELVAVQRETVRDETPWGDDPIPGVDDDAFAPPARDADPFVGVADTPIPAARRQDLAAMETPADAVAWVNARTIHGDMAESALRDAIAVRPEWRDDLMAGLGGRLRPAEIEDVRSRVAPVGNDWEPAPARMVEAPGGNARDSSARFRDRPTPQDEIDRHWNYQRRELGEARPLWTMRNEAGEIVKWGRDQQAMERELDKEFFPERFTIEELAPGDTAADVARITPERIEPIPVAGFDHPDDVAAARQMDSLEHDLRMFVMEEEGRGTMVRLNEEGDLVSAADALEDLDTDEAAIAAARACMVPDGRDA